MICTLYDIEDIDFFKVDPPGFPLDLTMMPWIFKYFSYGEIFVKTGFCFRSSSSSSFSFSVSQNVDNGALLHQRAIHALNALYLKHL